MAHFNTKALLVIAAILFGTSISQASNKELFIISKEEISENENSSKNSQINYEELEKKFPKYFAGFTVFQKDEKLLNKLRDEKEVFKENSEFKEKYIGLYQLLNELKNEKLNPYMEKTNLAIENPQKHNFIDYVFLLAQLSLELSEKTEEESQFFKVAGFSYPYSFIESKSELDKSSIFSFLSGASTDYDDRMDFQRFVAKSFFDRQNQLEKIIEKSPTQSIAHLFPCKDGILGLYYLAWSYLKGIHSIPVPLVSSDDDLHGAVKSSWGKGISHDGAHSTADPSDYNVKQFAAHLLNTYAFLMQSKAKELTPQIKKNYPIHKMIPVFGEFALKIHELWRNSRLEILETALMNDLKESNGEKLSNEFKAYATGCFMEDHELSPEMHRFYGTESFVDLLAKSVGNNQQVSEKLNEKEAQPKEEDKSEIDLFSTSFINGETKLTDEQIWDIIKVKPLKEFTSNRYKFYLGNDKLDENNLSSYEIHRHKLYIEAPVFMITGEDHVFRAPTNYTRTLNFAHDLGILKAAKGILKEKFNYDLPKAPLIKEYENREDEFGIEAQKAANSIQEGFKHLKTYFFEVTSLLAQKTPSSRSPNVSIAEHFSIVYSTELLKLAKQMPTFIISEEQREDEQQMKKLMQIFINEAVKEPTSMAEPSKEEIKIEDNSNN